MILPGGAVFAGYLIFQTQSHMTDTCFSVYARGQSDVAEIYHSAGRESDVSFENFIFMPGLFPDGRLDIRLETLCIVHERFMIFRGEEKGNGSLVAFVNYDGVLRGVRFY